MTSEALTDPIQIDALPDRTVVIDRNGDVWQYRSGLWCTYETQPVGSERLARKHGPVRLLVEAHTPTDDEREELLRDLYTLRSNTGGPVLRRIEIVDRALAALSLSEAPEPSDAQPEVSDAQVEAAARTILPLLDPTWSYADYEEIAERWVAEARDEFNDAIRAALRAAGAVER